MQRYQPNGDDPFEEEEPQLADDAGNAPTQEFYPPYDGSLPPLPPRQGHRAQAATYGTQTPAPKPPVPESYEEEGDEQRIPRTSIAFGIAKFNQFLKWLLSVIEVLFALRFVMKLLSASQDNPFIHLLYSSTSPLLAPFTAALGVQAHVEWDTLLAMLVYFLAILALIRLLRLFIIDPEL